MKVLAKACAEKTIDEILEMPDVQERLKVYFEQRDLFIGMVKTHAKAKGKTVFVDLRGVEPIYAGNRFLLYTLYPDQNISVWVVDGRNKANCAITVGYSVLNRTATLDVGSMLLKYGGGGHHQVGTCQVPYKDAGKVIKEIMAQCNGGE
jgi:nanoRNase/pAp phosphatase (c-di-AMP/oligoRNAs hydrolase)